MSAKQNDLNRRWWLTTAACSSAAMFVGYKLYNTFEKARNSNYSHAKWRSRWTDAEQNGTTVSWESGRPSVACQFAMPRLFGGNQLESKQHIKVFVPLCGATPDMIEIQKYLRLFVDLCDNKPKFTIYGVDLSNLAIKSFFSEKLKISIEKDDNMKITENEEADFTKYEYYQQGSGFCLFAGDLFNKNIINEMGGPDSIDYILDVNSLVAINVPQREQYVRDVCLKLLKPGGRILLQTYYYSPNPYQRPPWPFTKKSIAKYYQTEEKNGQIEDVLERKFSDFPYYKKKLKAWGLPEALINVWIITQ